MKICTIAGAVAEIYVTDPGAKVTASYLRKTTAWFCYI